MSIRNKMYIILFLLITIGILKTYTNIKYTNELEEHIIQLRLR